MSAPKRWLEDGSTSDVERDLLRSGLAMDPPPGAEGEVWAALLGKLPPPPPPGDLPPADGGAAAGNAASGAHAAAKAVTAAKLASAPIAVLGGGVLKSALIGAGSALALVATYAVVAPPSAPDASPPSPAALSAAPSSSAIARAPIPPRPAPEPSVALSALPALAASASAAPSPSAASADPRPAPPSPPPATGSLPAAGEPAVLAAERETMIREESRLVGEARDALRRGDAPGALTLLEQIRGRFPAGVLGQEREVLTIEALARSGRRPEAAARADAFIKAHPQSPLVTRVESFSR